MGQLSCTFAMAGSEMGSTAGRYRRVDIVTGRIRDIGEC